MSKMNALDWKIYESITKYIYETLGKEFGVTIEGYGQDYKVSVPYSHLSINLFIILPISISH